MARKKRDTLKKYFEKGRLPSQEHFSDLIDSMLNVIDEGFDKSVREGFQVSQLGNDGKLISFYKNIDVKSPLWSIKIDWSTENLIFGSASNPNVLSLVTGTNDAVGDKGPDIVKNGRIGVNKKDPAFELDVEGTIASCGRIGGISGDISADGKWHNVIDRLDGCNAFEIMAGVGKEKTGKYAILHAFALKTFNAKGKITYHQAHYGSGCNSLKLRWKEDASNKYKLQLKTGCCYKDEEIIVKYHLTQLWFDPFMRKCKEKK